MPRDIDTRRALPKPAKRQPPSPIHSVKGGVNASYAAQNAEYRAHSPQGVRGAVKAGRAPLIPTTHAARGVRGGTKLTKEPYHPTRVNKQGGLELKTPSGAIQDTSLNLLKEPELERLSKKHGLLGRRSALEESGERAERAAGRGHYNIGIVAPPLPGLGFVAGGAAVGKTMNALPEPSGHSFAAKFWNSAAKTLTNLPAATVEFGKHPIRTSAAMLHVYGDPKKAFDENPAGTLMAFLPVFHGIDTATGAAIRAATKGKVLSTVRPGLDFEGAGIPRPREYSRGAVTQLAQRVVSAKEKESLPVAPNIEGLKKVSGKTFAYAVKKAKRELGPRGGNLTEHPASAYSEAYLTPGGKAGYAIVKTGKKLKDGREHVEAVNLFRRPKGPKGVAEHLMQHAISRGANRLDAFEGPLTEKYASHGFREVARMPFDEKYAPEGWQRDTHLRTRPDVLEMERPKMNAATGRQTRKYLYGRGFSVSPSQADILHGGHKLAQNYELMRARHFLSDHLKNVLSKNREHTSGLYNDALMVLGEHYAKSAGTFWHDVQDRLANLTKARETGEITGTDAAANKQQIETLQRLVANKDKISPKELAAAEKSSGAIGGFQRELWERENAEGIGLHEQLMARHIPGLLTHGHLLGRGKLSYLDEPGEHGYVGMLRKTTTEVNKLSREITKQRQKIKDLRLGKNVSTGHHFRLQELKEAHDEALIRANDLAHKVHALKMKGAIAGDGSLHPGVYDEQGVRLTKADAEKLVNEHFGGREPMFVTHKSDMPIAKGTNKFMPRTNFPSRTGRSAEAGTYDNSPGALKAQIENAVRSLSVYRGANEVVSRMGRGRFNNEGDAVAAAENMNKTAEGEAIAHHFGKWVVYRMGPHRLADLSTPGPYADLLKQVDVQHKAVHEAEGTYTLLPERVADRFNKWQKTEDAIAESPLRLLTTPWRQTNLYTSVRWPFGTTQENAIRLAFHGVNPLVVGPDIYKIGTKAHNVSLGKGIGPKRLSLSFDTGSRIPTMLEDMIRDPEVPRLHKDAALMMRTMFGTGNFAGAQLHELEPELRALTQKYPWLQKMSESRLNTMAWGPYRHFIGNALNQMETNAKVAAGGKLALNEAGFFKKMRSMTRDQAARDYVKRITSSPEAAIKEAEKLMEVMGNWNHLTPFTRRGQAEYAPFVLWWLNSAKFIFKTLPKDHPYALGLLAAMVTATGQEKRDVKEYLVGDVPMTLPYLGKINLNPVHYSPFDIFHEPLHTAGSMIAPQITEPVMESAGVDPLTREKYEGEEGAGQEGVSAARILEGGLGSFLPGARLGLGITRQGGIPRRDAIFPWQTVPGSNLGVGKAVAKTFSPFMFNYDRTKKEPPSIKRGRKRVQGEGSLSGEGGLARRGRVQGEGGLHK